MATIGTESMKASHKGRHQVGGRRPARDHGHPWPAGHVGVPLRHVPGPLFVADEDVADGRVEDRVVGGQNATARQAEHHLDMLEFQAPDKGRAPVSVIGAKSLGRGGWSGGRAGPGLR